MVTSDAFVLCVSMKSNVAFDQQTIGLATVPRWVTSRLMTSLWQANYRRRDRLIDSSSVRALAHLITDRYRHTLINGLLRHRSPVTLWHRDSSSNRCPKHTHATWNNSSAACFLTISVNRSINQFFIQKYSTETEQDSKEGYNLRVLVKQCKKTTNNNTIQYER